MSKLLMLCCTFAVFVVVGCSEDESPVDSDTNSFSYVDFIPNGTVGTTYDMKMTVTSSVSSPDEPKQELTKEGIARFTILARDVTTPDGKYKGIKGLNYTNFNKQEIVDTIYYAANTEGILSYEKLNRYRPTFLLKYPINVGNEWSEILYSGDTNSIRIASTNDTINIATGTYSALKLVVAVNNSTVPGTRTRTSWLGKEVGFLKSVSESKNISNNVTHQTVTTTEVSKITKP